MDSPISGGPSPSSSHRAALDEGFLDPLYDIDPFIEEICGSYYHITYYTFDEFLTVLQPYMDEVNRFLNPVFHRFLDLPLELRELVSDFYMTTAMLTKPTIQGGGFSRVLRFDRDCRLPALCRINVSIRQEAIKSFLRSTI